MIPADQRTCIVTPTCPPVCEDSIPLRDEHGHGCPHYQAPRPSAWCPECRTTRPVVDQFGAGHMTCDGEVEYGVTELDCGHSLQGPAHVVAAAPGAPYAGERVVAASTRASDLLDAQKRQQLRDLIQDGQL